MWDTVIFLGTRHVALLTFNLFVFIFYYERSGFQETIVFWLIIVVYEIFRSRSGDNSNSHTVPGGPRSSPASSAKNLNYYLSHSSVIVSSQPRLPGVSPISIYYPPLFPKCLSLRRVVWLALWRQIFFKISGCISTNKICLYRSYYFFFRSALKSLSVIIKVCSVDFRLPSSFFFNDT